MEKWTVVKGVRLFLYTVRPFQRILDHKAYTHEWMLTQALNQVQSYHGDELARVFRAFGPWLVRGVYWADQDWKNVNHYYNYLNGKGLWKFKNGFDEFYYYYHLALCELRQGDLNKSFFYLGAAAHLMQDMCVPHHVHNRVFSGHQEFESWVRSHLDLPLNYKLDCQIGQGLADYLNYNAKSSAEWFAEVNLDQGRTNYAEAAQFLLPLAIQSTLQIYLEFWREICQNGFSRVGVA